MSRKKLKNKIGGRFSGLGSTQVRQIKNKLYEIFSVNDRSYSYQELVRKLRLDHQKWQGYLKDCLSNMENKKQIKRLHDGCYVSNVKSKYIEGKVDHVNPNFAYIVMPENKEDIRVKTSALHYAIHGDIVNVAITFHMGKKLRAEGKVISILKRGREEFVGRIEISENFSFVIPDIRNVHFHIMIYPEKIKTAKPNDKVLVKIDKWHDATHKSPIGSVIEVLGPTGENDVEIHSIMAEFHLPFRFLKKVEVAADKISNRIAVEEIKKRRDFRAIPTFTVDPHDAKDFDDALSIQKLDGGKYEIGVHIADVSHYVQEGNELDKEASERATSVYLVDRTIPMLPEKLSNGLCSLRPHEEKLTFSTVFEMNEKGSIQKKWFGKTIIKSDRRFTYEEAQERIEGLESEFSEAIITLNNIAKELRKKRFRNGAINFETVEVTISLDENGKPLEVIPKERKDAHKMIEEFMLLANQEVARYIFKWKEKEREEGSKTFVYRVHDDPDPEKLQTFATFATLFGHKVDIGSKSISFELNRLMESIKGKPEQNVLGSLAIRSMAKALYTTEPRKHFGLAFDHYTHFTSPIRRYPDIMVHRLLKHYLQGGKSVESEEYEQLCIHSSEREKRATDAARTSIKYKQVEFMQTMIGQKFGGIVSGVTEWGIFVEIIETKCEGMIRMTDLDDDFYEFEEKQMRVIGRHKKRIITLGDNLEILVAKTDVDKRTIDLALVEE